MDDRRRQRNHRPDGPLPGRTLYDREELITAEIDLEKIIAAKATHDTTGHYTRPDLLHFEIVKPVK